MPLNIASMALERGQYGGVYITIAHILSQLAGDGMHLLYECGTQVGRYCQQSI